jgi:hypothetical protein
MVSHANLLDVYLNEEMTQTEKLAGLEVRFLYEWLFDKYEVTPIVSSRTGVLFRLLEHAETRQEFYLWLRLIFRPFTPISKPTRRYLLGATPKSYPLNMPPPKKFHPTKQCVKCGQHRATKLFSGEPRNVCASCLFQQNSGECRSLQRNLLSQGEYRNSSWIVRFFTKNRERILREMGPNGNTFDREAFELALETIDRDAGFPPPLA